VRVAFALVVLLSAGSFASAQETRPDAPSAEKALDTALGWLVKHQNADGSWGSHRSKRPSGIWCDVPGGHLAFRTATSALATMSLRGLAPARRSAATERTASRGLAFLVETGAVKRSQPTQLYNVWALAYSLRALAEAMIEPREGEDLKAVRRVASEIVRELALHQFVAGGWGYFDFRHHTFHPSGDSASFTTATCLIALHRAREAGLSVPARTVRRGLACLRRCRNPDGSWIYSMDHRNWRRGLINRPKGSLSRTPACALALNLFTGRPEVAEIEMGLRRLVDHHRFALAAVREPVPHRSWYGVSGYFYLYGYAYAALALERLPEASRARFRKPLIEAILAVRQPDGCYWDYPLYDYHKSYGTAYAVMALNGLVPAR
jgi:hypothetical protein